MKRFIFPAVSLLAASVCFAATKDDVVAAAKKVADSANYSWTATTEIEGGQFTPAPINGKAEKGGFALITSEREGNTTTAVLKGDKGVVKTDDGWKTAEQLRSAGGGGGGGGGGRGGMRGAQLLRSRPPADDAVKLAEKAKELKEANGVISGDLTDEGAKEFASMGRGRGGGGGGGNEPKNAKGSVKFWIKDGQLVKTVLKTSATMSFNGEDRDVGRTTTYEIKEVGTTKVEVPEEAKKALGS